MPVDPSPSVASESLKRKLAEAVATVPDGKRGAWETWATKTGIETSLGWKVSERWSISGWGAREWSGSWDAGARARFVW